MVQLTDWWVVRVRLGDEAGKSKHMSEISRNIKFGPERLVFSLIEGLLIITWLVEGIRVDRVRTHTYSNDWWLLICREATEDTSKNHAQSLEKGKLHFESGLIYYLFAWEHTILKMLMLPKSILKCNPIPPNNMTIFFLKLDKIISISCGRIN